MERFVRPSKDGPGPYLNSPERDTLDCLIHISAQLVEIEKLLRSKETSTPEPTTRRKR